LIAELKLEPLGFEGGWFKETVRSEPIEPSYVGLERSLHTAILYMLTPDTRGLLHRLRYGEVYHFYQGDPVDLVLLFDGGHTEHVVLGHDIAAGQRVQHFVPAGVWQGSRVQPGGRYGLMGTTMAPGFDLQDFELGDREALCAAWPEAKSWIELLTPDVRRTPHWELVAATRDLLFAELRSIEALAAGTRSVVDPSWPRGIRDEGSLRKELDGLALDQARRGWGSWYVVRRSDRRLLGTASFQGPPREGAVQMTLTLPSASAPELQDLEAVMRALALADGRVRTVDLRED